VGCLTEDDFAAFLVDLLEDDGAHSTHNKYLQFFKSMHADLKTTAIYLNVTAHGLQDSMRKFEEAKRG